MTTTRLRIKIKSLAAEARMIRLEERKLTGRQIRLPAPPSLTLPKKVGRKVRDPKSGQLPWLRAHQGDPAILADREDELQMLHKHRTVDVRVEARAALLAYGLLRGQTYSKIEPEGSSKPNWEIVVGLTARFGAMPKSFAEKIVQGWAEGMPFIPPAMQFAQTRPAGKPAENA